MEPFKTYYIQPTFNHQYHLSELISKITNENVLNSHIIFLNFVSTN